MAGPLDPGAALAIEPVGRVFHDGFQTTGEFQQGSAYRGKRLCGGPGRLDKLARQLRAFGFDPVSRFQTAFVARECGRTHGSEQFLERAEGGSFGQTSQPAFGGQRLSCIDCGFDGHTACIVIACDIGEPRRKPTATAAAVLFRADDPAAQFDRFLPGKRGGERAVGSIEHMMPFVEDDPRRTAGRIAPARCVDHYQRMVGNHEIRLRRIPGAAFDEAFPIVRAAGVDAFAALVRQRRDPAFAEERTEPAGKIAADHVAVLRIGCPAGHEMGQDCGASGKPALQRIFQIEQAKVIFPPLSHHDWR